MEVTLTGYKLPSLRTQDHIGSFPLLHFKRPSALSHSVSVSVFAAFFNVSRAASFAWVSADVDAWWRFVNLPHNTQEPSLVPAAALFGQQHEGSAWPKVFNCVGRHFAASVRVLPACTKGLRAPVVGGLRSFISFRNLAVWLNSRELAIFRKVGPDTSLPAGS